MNGFDTLLFDRINQVWANPFLDHLMPAFSSFDAWRPLMIGTAVGFVIFGKTGGRRFILSIAIGLLLGDVILSHALKETIGRPRPRDVHPGTVVRSLAPGEPRILHVLDPPVVTEILSEAEPGKHGSSFPSSHVINVFMLATVAYRFRRIAGLVLAAGGLVVSWSRIYCGAHWPGDIPPSILLGIGTGLAATWIVSHLARRFGWTAGGGIVNLDAVGADRDRSHPTP